MKIMTAKALRDLKAQKYRAGLDRGLESARERDPDACEVMRPTPVSVMSIFKVGDKIKCTGRLADLPWNPHHERIAQFDVSFNGERVRVEMLECHQDVGWIAQSVESLDEDHRSVCPTVELRRARS
jgi:hypothetical protein